MINAVPRRYSSAELNIAPDARCPLCRTSERGGRWVLCPMIGGQPICYGCCLDYQGLARAVDFEDDPFRDLFDDLSRQTGLPVVTLRRRCLEHQQEIVSEQLGDPHAVDDRDSLLNLAFRVSEAVLDAGGS